MYLSALWGPNQTSKKKRLEKSPTSPARQTSSSGLCHPAALLCQPLGPAFTSIFCLLGSPPFPFA